LEHKKLNGGENQDGRQAYIFIAKSIGMQINRNFEFNRTFYKKNIVEELFLQNFKMVD
jgi:soluble P-type ATPase